MEGQGGVLETPEQPLTVVREEARRTLKKIAVDVEHNKSDDWKGPLERTNENLTFIVTTMQNNPSIYEFFLRSERKVILATENASETQLQFLLRTLKIGPDRRSHIEFNIISLGDMPEIMHQITEFISPNNLADKDGKIQTDKLLESWKKGKKDLILQIARLEKKDLIGKLLKAIK